MKGNSKSQISTPQTIDWKRTIGSPFKIPSHNCLLNSEDRILTLDLNLVLDDRRKGGGAFIKDPCQ
jgi:hypothetical protein